MNLGGTSFVAAAFAGAMLASGAQAVTFSFTGADLDYAPYRTMSSGDIDLTVYGGTFASRHNPSEINFFKRWIDVDRDGIGAIGLFDGDQIDGSLGNDVVVFHFSEEVRIDTVIFGNVDSNDDFAFGKVYGTSFDRIVDFAQVANPFDLSTIATVAERTGIAFGFGAIGHFDNYTIKEIVVSSLSQPPAQQPPAVPLPASGLLLLGGLAIAGGVSARRRTKN